MLFDLATLISTVLALFRIREARVSPLWTQLYKHGFIYFMITFLVNLMALVSGFMHLYCVHIDEHCEHHSLDLFLCRPKRCEILDLLW